MSKKPLKQNEKIKELEAQISELKSGWQRTQADFINYKNRVMQEKTEILKFANEDLILQILPVLDNFTRALNHRPKEQPQIHELHKFYEYIKGLELIKIQLEQILNTNGLVKIPINPGDQFDPQIHEAISTEKSNKFKHNQIVEVIEAGYKLGDKIIRPAKVKVAK